MSLMTSIQMSLLEQVDVDTLERMLSVSGVGRFKQLRFKYKKSKYSAKTALKKKMLALAIKTSNNLIKHLQTTS